MIITYCMLLKLKVRLILLSHIEWILINRVTRAVSLLTYNTTLKWSESLSKTFSTGSNPSCLIYCISGSICSLCRLVSSLPSALGRPNSAVSVAYELLCQSIQSISGRNMEHDGRQAGVVKGHP